MLPGVLSSPGPALSGAEKGATAKVPPLLCCSLLPLPGQAPVAPPPVSLRCATVGEVSRTERTNPYGNQADHREARTKWTILSTVWCSSKVQKELVLCFLCKHIPTFPVGDCVCVCVCLWGGGGACAALDFSVITCDCAAEVSKSCPHEQSANAKSKKEQSANACVRREAHCGQFHSYQRQY